MMDERARDLLDFLRDHPWSTPAQGAGLSGIPLRSTQRYLAQLSDDGLAQRACVPHVRGRLYAPAAAGVSLLAGDGRRAKTYARAFRLDSAHLAGALLRVRALGWARDFLAALATSVPGDLQWAITPWEVRVGRQLLRLDGYGCVLWLGKFVPFVVLADLGGLAVSGYAGRFRQFARWAGNGFAGTGVRPVLVMLTTHARRAGQLSVLWESIVEKRGTDLDLCVARFEDLFSGAATWLHQGKREPLWVGCPGSPKRVDRPWPSLAPPENAPPVSVQDLDDWCESDGRGRRALVRVFQSLSGHEWTTLEGVARWPLLQGADLALLEGTTCGAGMVGGILQRLEEQGLVEAVWESDAQQRLLELQEAQLQGRLAQTQDGEERRRLTKRLAGVREKVQDVAGQEPGGEKRYVLSSLGLALLAATRGMGPLAYGRARLWPVGYEERDGRQVAIVRTARYLLAYEHTRLLNEFFLGLRQLAEEQWYGMSRSHELLIWDSVECARWYWDDRGRQLLLPDGGGVYRIGDEVYEFWVEMDRGHSAGKGHGRALRRKYERYYDYRRRPDAIYGSAMPRLLIVTPQIGRSRQVQQAILDLARERRETPLPALIATLDDIWREPERLADGTARPRPVGGSRGRGRPPRRVMWPGLRAWRRVDDMTRTTWCFDGLARMPTGTQRGLNVSVLAREVQSHTRRSTAQRRRRQVEREG